MKPKCIIRGRDIILCFSRLARRKDQNFATGGVVNSSITFAGFDNPNRQEQILPEEVLSKFQGHGDPEKWRPSPFLDRKSISYMQKQIKALEQEKWTYLAAGVLAGIVGMCGLFTIVLIVIK